jgi:hypothetical protein
MLTMNVIKVIPLMTLVLLFGLLVAENKLGYQSPQRKGIKLCADVAGWKKVLVLWNDHVRYGGLFLLWFGSNAFALQVRRQPGEESVVFLGVAALGIVMYMVAFSWPVYVRKSDREV